MKLEDLLNEYAVDGTIIQNEETFKKFIGFEILINGYINNIDNDRVGLCQFSHHCSCNSNPSWKYVDYWDRWGHAENPHNYLGHCIYIKYAKRDFEKELLTISQGNEVKIIAKLIDVSFPENLFVFNLLSIENIFTQ
jgi:hypothetical protein